MPRSLRGIFFNTRQSNNMYRMLNIYRGAFSNIQKNIRILAIAMFINRSGSMVLLFTSLYLTKDLHFTIAQAGLALSFYGIGSVMGSYAGGWLTDRRNFFDIMVLSLIISGLILLLLLLTADPILISLIIFAYAFTADLFRPANSKAIVAYSVPEFRTRAVSLVRLAINLGFSLGPAIGGFIALYLGYKWLFVIDSCTGFAAAIMLFVYLPRQHDEPKGAAASAALDDHSTSAYRDRPYLFFIGMVALYGVCFFQLFASIPQYFSRECHFHEDTIGLLLALNGLLVVLIEMPLVAALEKDQRIFRFIVTGVLCIPVAMLILYLGKGMMIAAIGYTFIITMAEIFAMPFMMNYALSRPGKERQGQYSALYSISYGLANIAAPLLGLGIASSFGFNYMFGFFIVLGLLTAAGFYLLGKKDAARRRRKE
jgi:predicted MFS family arabinose efflux permease